MVILGKGRERESESLLMAMGPERSKPLHNFTLPCSLRWGKQRSLRCMKVDSNGEISDVDRRSSATDLIERRRESVFEKLGVSNDRRESFELSAVPESRLDNDEDEGIETVRAKLMFDLQTAVDKMKDAILRERLQEERTATVEPADKLRPWNLRTRRAACKAPNRGSGSGGGAGSGGGKSLNADVLRPNSASPLRTESKSLRLRGIVDGVSGDTGGEKRGRAKFSVSLSQREIAEDFMAMVGHRPSRRPKKRTKNVQKQLDMLLPGLWLTEITADDYKVLDAPDNGKR